MFRHVIRYCYGYDQNIKVLVTLTKLGNAAVVAAFRVLCPIAHVLDVTTEELGS